MTWTVSEKPVGILSFIEGEGISLSKEESKWWEEYAAWKGKSGLFPGWLGIEDCDEHHRKMDIIRRYGRYCYWLEQENNKPRWVSDDVNF